MESGAEAEELSGNYLNELLAEKDNIDPACVHATQWLAREIERVQAHPGAAGPKKDLLEIHNDKPTPLAIKVRLPDKEFPEVNFAGRIIGSKGSEMRKFQEMTGTKLFVFGKGSMTDKKKEDELRELGGKYAHLSEDLHVMLKVYAHPVEAYRRMSIALHELRAYLGPNDPPGHSNGGFRTPAGMHHQPVPGMTQPYRAPGPSMPGPPRGSGFASPRGNSTPQFHDPGVRSEWPSYPQHAGFGNQASFPASAGTGPDMGISRDQHIPPMNHAGDPTYAPSAPWGSSSFTNTSNPTQMVRHPSGVTAGQHRTQPYGRGGSAVTPNNGWTY